MNKCKYCGKKLSYPRNDCCEECWKIEKEMNLK